MRRAVERFRVNNKKATFVLQLTAMVDMFTILIVFLLKSFSTSSVHLTPVKGLTLPHSTSYTNPVEALKLIVAKDGIYIDEKMVVPLEEGKISDSALDASDPDFITDLFTELDQQVEISKQIREENKEFEFEGKVVMQADAALDYGLLKKVMYTTSMAGFADMKLATMSSD